MLTICFQSNFDNGLSVGGSDGLCVGLGGGGGEEGGFGGLVGCWWPALALPPPANGVPRSADLPPRPPRSLSPPGLSAPITPMYPQTETNFNIPNTKGHCTKTEMFLMSYFILILCHERTQATINLIPLRFPFSFLVDWHYLRKLSAENNLSLYCGPLTHYIDQIGNTLHCCRNP